MPASEHEPGAYTPLCLMTKKESEKEVERPHYYSQFWLDVAAGRRIIGTPKTDEGAEGLEPEMPDTIVLRKPMRTSTAAVTDGYQDTLSHSEIEPALSEEDFAEPELEEELVGAVDDLDIPNIVVEEPEVPVVNVTAAQKEEEEEVEPEEEFFEDEEEEEEEDWTIARGRKKAKPSRPTKLPPKRPEKRRRF